MRELWEVLRRLRAEGGTMVLITHKLDEVIEISDAITVMRHGETVAHMPTRDTTPAEIARAMVGRDVALALDAAALLERGEQAILAAQERGEALHGLTNYEEHVAALDRGESSALAFRVDG